MPFSELARLGHDGALRILLIDAGPAGGMPTLTLTGLLQPWQLAARLLGSQRLEVGLVPAAQLPARVADAARAPHLVMLVADEADGLDPALRARAIACCRQAPFWGAAGAAVLWLVRAGHFDGARIALPWALYGEAFERDVDGVFERVLVTPSLFEVDGARLSCCGGAASLDFALGLLHACFGAALAAQVQEALCVERVRSGDERQRGALQARVGASQPKLSEAMALMEANIEEPLSTDEVARLVGLSRRQLERLFKQYLGALPSRYYLELRLRRARTLLIETHHSIVQVGLMCGFSSGAHFSTAFGTLFGITPREQRQRRLLGGSAGGGTQQK